MACVRIVVDYWYADRNDVGLAVDCNFLLSNRTPIFKETKQFAKPF